jgi:formylglycine-generating enzyme required for sulfatase activity
MTCPKHGGWEAVVAALERGDHATACKALLLLARQGDAKAQHDLAIAYATGEGVAQDSAEAVKWYREAAEQGNAKAQFDLGGMYRNGQGVAEDAEEAVKWYRMAAAQGDASAQFNLAIIYDSGIGLRRDAAEAAKWYREAAERGVAGAQYNLGQMYDTGDGVAEDRGAAAKWYRKAAEQGHAEALVAEAEEVCQQTAEGHCPGHVFRDFPEGPEMVVITAGKFMMGQLAYYSSIDNLTPRHRVAIPRPIAVGKYAVTFDEFDCFVAADGYDHRPGDKGFGRGRRPVIDVSWHDARAYVAWLGRQTGKDYRLLSEAEWEYAARAGTLTLYYFGETISTDQANYDNDDPYESGRKGVYREQTVPVGTFPANAFGLHEMYGNVYEWVEDCWHSNYTGAPANGSAWTQGGDDDYRVNRGGSWLDEPWFLTSATRNRDLATIRHFDLGFRVARTLD